MSTTVGINEEELHSLRAALSLNLPTSKLMLLLLGGFVQPVVELKYLDIAVKMVPQFPHS